MAFDAFEFMNRWVQETSEPPRRRNRNKSGRANRRQDQTRRAYKAVGGRVSAVSAIYGGNDKADPENPRNYEMCVVTDREVKAVGEFTNPVYSPGGRYNYVGRVGCV